MVAVVHLKSTVAATHAAEVGAPITAELLAQIRDVSSAEIAEARKLIGGVDGSRAALKSTIHAMTGELERLKKEQKIRKSTRGLDQPELGRRIDALKGELCSVRDQLEAMRALQAALETEVAMRPVVGAASVALELGIISKKEFAELTDGKLSAINAKVAEREQTDLRRQRKALGKIANLRALTPAEQDQLAQLRAKETAAGALSTAIAAARKKPEHRGDNVRDAMGLDLHRLQQMIDAVLEDPKNDNRLYAMYRSVVKAGAIALLGTVGVSLAVPGAIAAATPLAIGGLVAMAAIIVARVGTTIAQTRAENAEKSS